MQKTFLIWRKKDERQIGNSYTDIDKYVCKQIRKNKHMHGAIKVERIKQDNKNRTYKLRLRKICFNQYEEDKNEIIPHREYNT